MLIFSEKCQITVELNAFEKRLEFVQKFSSRCANKFFPLYLDEFYRMSDIKSGFQVSFLLRIPKYFLQINFVAMIWTVVQVEDTLFSYIPRSSVGNGMFSKSCFMCCMQMNIDKKTVWIQIYICKYDFKVLSGFSKELAI